jgi:hypothetical protein
MADETVNSILLGVVLLWDEEAVRLGCADGYRQQQHASAAMALKRTDFSAKPPIIPKP